MKESLDDDISAMQAEKENESRQSLSLLPPHANHTGIFTWRNIKKNRLNIFLVLVVTPAAMGIIYLDHQRTTRQQIATIQHLRCIHALKSRRIDFSLFPRMGIKNPPPTDLEDLEQNVNLCLIWRERLQLIQPAGNWPKELVEELIKRKEIEFFLDDLKM